MIELAPLRKRGLSIANPIIAASGSVGYAGEAKGLIALERFGAIVTAPISLRPRRGSPPPRLLETPGGMLLNHGDPSAGWPRLHEHFGNAWARNKAPIIAHVVGHTSLGELARRSEATLGISALEYDVADAEALGWLGRLRAGTELPILARVPYGEAALAARVAETGADALVCILPPRGAALDRHSGRMIEGRLYGPFVKALALQTVRDVRAAGVSAPLIACGGVHTRADVDELLGGGACAVMVDSLAWVDPNGLNALLSG